MAQSTTQIFKTPSRVCDAVCVCADRVLWSMCKHFPIAYSLHVCVCVGAFVCRHKLRLACIVCVYFCLADYVNIYIYIPRKRLCTKATYNKNPWCWALSPLHFFHHLSFSPSFHSFSKSLTPGCLSFFFIKVPGCLFCVGCADVEYNGTCTPCDYMATHTRSITDMHWMTDEMPARESSFTHNPSVQPRSELNDSPECPYQLVERGWSAMR